MLCVTAAVDHDTASDGSGKSGCGQQAWPSMVGASKVHVVAYSMLQGSSPKKSGGFWWFQLHQLGLRLRANA